MSGVVKSETMQAYDAELRTYQLGVAAWLGIDPAEVANMEESVKHLHTAHGIPQPPDLLVQWESYGEPVEADEHLGRHQLPGVSMRGFSDEPPIFTNGVVLDWSEVERLRAEVGEKPEFPAPPGGWPSHWPIP